MSISPKKINLKKEAKLLKINLRELFPRSKVHSRTLLNAYQAKKLKREIKRIKESEGFYLLPDRPDFFHKAGFEVLHGKVYPAPSNIKIHTLYYCTDYSEHYSANFFGGSLHAVLIPTVQLPQFLKMQIAIDNEAGKWYDKITIREGDRDFWGQTAGLDKLHDDAESLLAYLNEYKRQGSTLDNEGNPVAYGEKGTGGDTFLYIQVCYLQFEYGEF